MSFGLDYTAVKGARDGTDLMLQALLHKFPNGQDPTKPSEEDKKD